MIIACPECESPFELRDENIAELVQIGCPTCSFRMILDFAAANDASLVEEGMRMASGFQSAADYHAASQPAAAEPDVPVAPEPEPEPVAPEPEPELPVPPTPEPVAPAPEPEPVAPAPEPIAAAPEPEPAPEPPDTRATIIGIVASFVGMWCANRNNNEANFGMVRRRPPARRRRARARARRALCSPPTRVALAVKQP